ncbi:MAG: hypothetical protein JNJ97_00525, partial [Alphaproteobacteria bacterium]|nr:hypothetical protein [Alphaproteobacteria bacterium]
HGDEAPAPTATPGILLARPELDALEALRIALAELEIVARNGDHDAVRAMLKKLVPEFKEV